MRTMDARPHSLFVVDYQHLWTEAVRFRSSPCDDCVRPGSGKEIGVENRGDFPSSGRTCDADSKSRVAYGHEETKRVEKGFDEAKPATETRQDFGWRVEELAGAQNEKVTNEKTSLSGITSRLLYSLEQTRVRQVDSQQEYSALGCKPCIAVQDGTEIRAQRSTFQEILRGNQGKKGSACEESKTLDGRNPDETCSYWLDKRHNATQGVGELARNITAALGPAGPGLLAVRNVPGVARLRKRLLPLAKRLALMPDQLRRLVLQEHDLNTDVRVKRPDRPVSAFATQLRYGLHHQSRKESCSKSPGGLGNIGRDSKVPTGNPGLPTRCQQDRHEEELGRIVRQLGTLMVEVGLLIARLCDEVCPGGELENAILESGIAKGRLIHYHSQFERDFMSSKTSKGSSNKAQSKVPRLHDLTNELKTNDMEQAALRVPGSCEKDNEKSEPWQQWHLDYGLLTILTSPLYWKFETATLEEGRYPMPSCTDMSSWNHAGGEHSGLIIMHQGVPQYVKIPPDCLIVQVGEAAQILSGGTLAAIAHCVCRPPQADVSRETFVVFLQPAWLRSLCPPPGFDVQKVLDPRDTDRRNGNSSPSYSYQGGHKGISQTEVEIIEPDASEECRTSEERIQLLHAIPPLASRWRDGCSFAEFSKLTTRLYYGVDGCQSQK